MVQLETPAQESLEAPHVREHDRAQTAAAAAVLVLAGAVAVILRFATLGATPLLPAEAGQALAVWQFLQPDQAFAGVGSPAYFSLTSIVAVFLGVSDTTMRLVPALFGVGLVLLPALLWRQIGAVGAATAALLLAVSPLNTAVARTAGGDSIALFAVLLALVAILRLSEEPDSRWLTVLVGAIGLGLTSSSLFYSGVLVVCGGWLLQRLARSGSVEFVRPPTRGEWGSALLVGAVVLILLGTRFLTFPGGLAATAALPGAWLGQFSLSGGVDRLLNPFLAVGRYEVILVVLGLVAVLWAVWRNHLTGTLFVYTLLAGLFLLLVQQGVLVNALLVVLPAYLLLGLVSTFLLRAGIDRSTWLMVGFLILCGAVLLVNITRFLRVGSEQQWLYLWIALLAVLAAAVVLYLLPTASGVAASLWLSVLVLLLFYQWGTTWYITRVAANDPRERWVETATDDDVRLLSETLHDVSWQATNSLGGLEIVSAVDTPVLRWYLREFRWTQFGTTLPAGADQAAIITPAAVTEPVLGSDYLGTDFGLLRPEPDPVVTATPLLDTLRWWFFHESPVPLVDERIILWVRADLVQRQ